MILCDTGPLVAAAVADDADHVACVELFARLRTAGREVLVPTPVVAEVGYLLGRLGGPDIEADFLQSVGEGAVTPVDLLSEDYLRAAALVRQYGDFPLGTTDAAVLAVAERLRIGDVATLDHRHFRAVRLTHVSALTLFP